MEEKRDHRLESRGVYTPERIGRPVVAFDQRAKLVTDMAGYERTLNERKKIGYGAAETPAKTETVQDSGDD